MEDRRVDGVGDDHRVAQLDPELAVLLEREPGLEDRRGGELGVDLRDPLVRAVVEAAVDADRAVDAVHHPRAAVREAPQAREVEVERVEQAGRRLGGDAVELDGDAARCELAREGPQELVATARGRRRELVKEREVGPALARADHVDLGSEATRRGARQAPRRSTGGAEASCRHAATHAERRFHTCTPGCSRSTSS